MTGGTEIKKNSIIILGNMREWWKGERKGQKVWGRKIKEMGMGRRRRRKREGRVSFLFCTASLVFWFGRCCLLPPSLEPMTTLHFQDSLFLFGW